MAEKYNASNLSIDQILNFIKSGEIAIPDIQRPFVWKPKQVRDLIDSLYNGYPTGYLIISIKVLSEVKGLFNSPISPKIRNMNIQDTYQKTIRYAAEKHAELQQTLPDSIIPYAVHLSNVAMEILVAASYTKDFDTKFAIQVALLHDILEDTHVTVEELEKEFGIDVATSVLALTKRDILPKEDQMSDCISRIKQCKKEVWAVKLADRITNLQPPPSHWNKLKKAGYLLEANYILKELQGANEYLENRLAGKIVEYQDYII